ncbi:MAG: efflux RND transporter periplasmic adaptor subunit [Muribaculaceae bacterium]|nr:efflux RND transporter periplasmic adaptor subunit [Muribaculaceae bacterium]
MQHKHLPLIALTAALLSLSSCGSSDKAASGADSTAVEEAPIVDIEQVHSRMVPQIGDYTATIEAFKTNNITSSTPNRIKNILVDVGAHVAAGQKVVVLDDVNIEQLKVRLENTRREYQRALKLLEIGGGTQQAVDQVKTELDAAQRQYDNVLENTILTSPISGVVTARNYDPGDMTGALPILTIEQTNPVKVVLGISESEFSKVKMGMKADVTLDTYPDEHFTGTVHLIHPTIDPATRSFTVEVTIANPNNRIVPGMFARVEFNFGEADHVVVPDRAVVKQTGSANRYVYVYDPATKTVSFNRVVLGQRVDNSYEVLEGVDDGNLVVITGQTRLANGIKVDARQK